MGWLSAAIELLKLLGRAIGLWQQESAIAAGRAEQQQKAEAEAEKAAQQAKQIKAKASQQHTKKADDSAFDPDFWRD